jgi:hypothetical protein
MGRKWKFQMRPMFEEYLSYDTVAVNFGLWFAAPTNWA